MVTRTRDARIERMEGLLATWIEDKVQKHQPLSQGIIQEKALSIWHSLSDLPGSSMEEFKASRGWFHRFCKRASLRNVKLQDESASADTEAASAYPEVLRKTIEEGGYTSRQVFNIDETGLYWKKLPTRFVKFG